MSAPSKRKDDAHERVRGAIERRLFKDKVPYFNRNPKKKPYPNLKPRAKGY